jgi:hypothetical protein
MCCNKRVFKIQHFKFLWKYKSSSNLISANDQEVWHSLHMIIKMLHNVFEVFVFIERNRIWKILEIHVS